MAHPLNRPRFDAGRAAAVVEGYGILQPRVGVEPAEHEPLALRAPVRRRAGHRPVHARRLRRLPGPVRRRLVHRQGHLRRRRLRARARRTASPRTASSATTCSKAATRAPACSATSQLFEDVARALRRRRQRAATAGSAATGSSPAGCCRACRALPAARRATRCRRCRAGRSSTTCAAAWCRPRSLSLLLLAWLAAAGARRGWTLRRAGDRRRWCRWPRTAPDWLRTPLQPAARRRTHVRGVAADRRGAQLAAQAASRWPACPTRRCFSARRDRAHAVARAAVTRRRLLEWRPSADVASAARRRRWPTCCAARACGVAPAAGAGAARRRWRSRGPARCPPRRRCCCCGCCRRCSPGGSSRPLRAPARRARARDQTRVPAPARAPHLALLRDLRRRRRQLPAARQRPGASGGARRAPHLADQHRASRCWPTLAAHDFGYLATRRAARRALDATLDDAGAHGALPRPLLQLVRHADARSRCARATSRRSTAATSPAHLLTLRPALLAAGRRAAAARRAGCAGVARHARRAASSRSRRTAARRRGAARRAAAGSPDAAGAPRTPRRRAARLARDAGRARGTARVELQPRSAHGTGRRRRCGRRRRAERAARVGAACCCEQCRAGARRAARARPRRARGTLEPTGMPTPAAAGRRRRRPRPPPSRRTRAARARAAPDDRRPRADAPRRWPSWTSASSTTTRATCWRSATTSPSAALDAGFYDLLASEARLASFVAIAQGQLPQEHWFALGRLLTTARRRRRRCCRGAARCSST